jgi:hypothetical protein
MFIPNNDVRPVHSIPQKIYAGVPGGCAMLPSRMTVANSAASSNISASELVKMNRINGAMKVISMYGRSLIVRYLNMQN